MKILLSWIGKADLDAASGISSRGNGPIYQAVTSEKYDSIWLLTDYGVQKADDYVKWISEFVTTPPVVEHIKLTNPTHYGQIFEGARDIVKKCRDMHGSDSSLTYHVSPGTPAMQAIWIVLAKTFYPATIIQSSEQSGVTEVNFPFDIAADYLPELIRESDNYISSYADGTSSTLAEYAKIIHRSKTMMSVIAKATKHSRHTYPVLILGETGTGKELIADAIHAASNRKGRLIPVNCGAIPENIVESELFGSIKGAFSGAVEKRDGLIMAANNGTLFLDEIGELPLSAQVKLLRVLQEKKVTKVGDKTYEVVDFRLVCATHRNLVEEVKAGRFREDLFHRIAITLITLPPLRERQEDINLLADHFLSEIKIKTPFLKNKEFSAAARNFLKQQPWPGNIRELQSTIIRAALSSTQNTISEIDFKESLFDFSDKVSDDVLNRQLGNGFKAEELLESIKKHYSQRAWDEADGKIKKAAELLGIKNYQTLYTWHSDLWKK